MSRALKGHAPRLLGNHAGAQGRQYQAAFTALVQRFGPFDAVSRQHAGAAAAMWVGLQVATVALRKAEDARASGKGRRPNHAALERLRRRVGLQWQSYDQAVRRLEALDDAGREFIFTITGRRRLPSNLRELVWVFGRRSGKSIMAALFAVWSTTCRTYTLAAGEVGVFMVVASDRRQARIIKRYISGLLHAASALKDLIENETNDAIWLTNGLVVEIQTCSFKSVRGYTCIGAVCDEVAFWSNEDSANPDQEVLRALRAAMATIPEALLVILTTPYARRGEVWRLYQQHYGQDASDRVLVVNAPTRTMNPTIDQAVIDDAYADDPVSAAAEYGGEWRRDVEAFLPLEAIEAVVVPGRLELGPIEVVDARGAFDGAGGTGGDSAVAAIAGTAQRGDKTIAVLAAFREVRPPHSPELVVAEFAAFFLSYGVTTISSDRYAGAWPVDAFAKHGITVVPCELSKSEAYKELLPMVMSGDVELLDSPRLKKQLGDLERRTARGGRESIDHPPMKTAHDDVANASTLALIQVGGFTSAGGGYFGFARVYAKELRAVREAAEQNIGKTTL